MLGSWKGALGLAHSAAALSLVGALADPEPEMASEPAVLPPSWAPAFFLFLPCATNWNPSPAASSSAGAGVGDTSAEGAGAGVGASSLPVTASGSSMEKPRRSSRTPTRSASRRGASACRSCPHDTRRSRRGRGTVGRPPEAGAPRGDNGKERSGGEARV
jgi:hypothetical protein